MQTPEEITDEIFEIYRDYGNYNYIGEKVSQTEHMVLTAMMAESEGCDDEVILAAFLHDIGHLLGHKNHLTQMDGWGTEDHEKVAADYLQSKGFPEKICKLVNNHVNAKRYLVTVDDDYNDKLSEASRMTLKYQGGEMSSEELKEFEEDPLKDMYIKFRTWEENAKESSLKVTCLHKYKELCLSVLRKYL